MGRPAVAVDMEAALDLLQRGEKVPAIAIELGISQPTLRSRIADLSQKQGLLLKYRAVQSLQLTELQARVLEAITSEKIEEAGLKDLVMSYKILKDKELVTEGKPSEIKGLVAHLIHMEKQDATVAGAKEDDIIDVKINDSDTLLTTKQTLAESLAGLDDSQF